MVAFANVLYNIDISNVYAWWENSTEKNKQNMYQQLTTQLWKIVWLVISAGLIFVEKQLNVNGIHDWANFVLTIVGMLCIKLILKYFQQKVDSYLGIAGFLIHLTVLICTSQSLNILGDEKQRNQWYFGLYMFFVLNIGLYYVVNKLQKVIFNKVLEDKKTNLIGIIVHIILGCAAFVIPRFYNADNTIPKSLYWIPMFISPFVFDHLLAIFKINV